MAALTLSRADVNKWMASAVKRDVQNNVCKFCIYISAGTVPSLCIPVVTRGAEWSARANGLILIFGAIVYKIVLVMFSSVSLLHSVEFDRCCREVFGTQERADNVLRELLFDFSCAELAATDTYRVACTLEGWEFDVELRFQLVGDGTVLLESIEFRLRRAA